jgi:hypothetical protein
MTQHPHRRQILQTLVVTTAGPFLGVTLAGPALAQTRNFDHAHAAWTALLKKHVVLLRGGQASQVRYAGFAQDREALRAYLKQLEGVNRASFDGFTRAQQMAFLINAYNAHTVELILTKYPDLKSIKDLGSLLSNPWKKKVAPLLGTMMTLDEIEHDTLRARGRYDDPRIHFAVNCASIGCPMLREEAFVDTKLEAQLEEQAQRFMGDKSRNRFNKDAGKLEVSKIFDWYGEDFKLGHKGIASLEGFMARHAAQLGADEASRSTLREGKLPITFLAYDWALNDAR